MKQEDKIQSEIFQWFWNSFPDYLIHAVPNGGHRNVVEALKLKSTGTVPGVADLIIHLPNAKCVMCEVKTEIGTQSPAQKKIEAKINKTERLILLLTEYRTALISEVVTGKIKVID